MGSEVLSLPAGFFSGKFFLPFRMALNRYKKFQKVFMLSPGGVYGRFRRFMLY